MSIQSDRPPATRDQPPGHTSMPAASATEDEESVAFTWRGWLAGFVRQTCILFILYALSIGPLYWQWYGARFSGGSKALAAFYEPLVILARLVPPFGEWMDWYVGLWIV